MIYIIIILGLSIIYLADRIRVKKANRKAQERYESYIEAQKYRASQSIAELEKQNMKLKDDLNCDETFLKFCWLQSPQVLRGLLDDFETKKELENEKE